jgi:hypothetical protein
VNGIQLNMRQTQGAREVSCQGGFSGPAWPDDVNPFHAFIVQLKLLVSTW